MIRVAQICADPGVPVFGTKGASVHMQAIARGFVRAGLDVTLFASRWDGEPPAELCAISRYELAPVPPGDAERRARAALAANQTLDEALAAAGPFDLVYERHALWAHAGMRHARRAGVPGVLEVNAPLLEEQARHRGGLPLPEEAERSARAAFADAAALVAVSPGVAAWLARFPETQGSVHVIPNGVDPDRFHDIPRRRPRADGAVTIGFLGTLKPWHGLPTLIEAASLLRDRHGIALRLLLVGDGPERTRIEAALAARGLDGATRLTGAVHPDAVPALLGAMDIAVAPYPAIAGFYFSPLKILEYMAAGLPVVASRVGHLAEMVRDGEDGLLCAPDDPAALAGAIARLARDRTLRRRLGAAARARVLRDHTWQSVVARVLALAGLSPAGQAAAA